MAIKFREQVWISCPTGVHNNFGLQIYSLDRTKVQRFSEMVVEFFSADCRKNRHRAFFQGGFCVDSPPDWRYVEIWGWQTPGVQDELWEFAQNVAIELDLPFEIN